MIYLVWGPTISKGFQLIQCSREICQCASDDVTSSTLTSTLLTLDCILIVLDLLHRATSICTHNYLTLAGYLG